MANVLIIYFLTCLDCNSLFAIMALMFETGTSVYVAPGMAAAACGDNGATPVGIAPKSLDVIDPNIPVPCPCEKKKTDGQSVSYWNIE